MSFSSLLVHRVDVYARSGNTDRFGQPVDLNPRQFVTGEDLVGSYPARCWQKSGGLTMRERSRDVFERYWILYTELDADVREDDAVQVVDPASGTLLTAIVKVKTSTVAYDSKGPHHKEFTLFEQSGPNPART